MLTIAGGLVLGWIGIAIVRAIAHEATEPKALPPPRSLPRTDARVTDPELRKRYGLPPLESLGERQRD